MTTPIAGGGSPDSNFRRVVEEAVARGSGQPSLLERIEEIYSETREQIEQRREEQEAEHARENAEFRERAASFGKVLAKQDAQFHADLSTRRMSADAEQAVFDRTIAAREAARIKAVQLKAQQQRSNGRQRQAPPPPFEPVAPPPSFSSQSTNPRIIQWAQANDTSATRWCVNQSTTPTQEPVQIQPSVQSNFDKDFGKGFGKNFGKEFGH